MRQCQKLLWVTLVSQLIDWSSRHFSVRERNSTNSCIHAFSCPLAKHREPFCIAACAFVPLWVNLCRNSDIILFGEAFSLRTALAKRINNTDDEDGIRTHACIAHVVRSLLKHVLEPYVQSVAVSVWLYIIKTEQGAGVFKTVAYNDKPCKFGLQFCFTLGENTQTYQWLKHTNLTLRGCEGVGYLSGFTS